MDRNSLLLKNTIIYTIGKFSSSLAAFLLLPIFTRYLSPEDYGEIDIILAYTFVVIPVFTLHASKACYRFLLDANSLDDQKMVISNSFAMLASGCCIFLLSSLLYFAVFPHEFQFLIIVYILLSGLAEFCQTVIRGLRKNLFFSALGVITALTTLLFNLLFIVGLHYKSISLLLSPLCGFIVVIIIVLTKFNLLDLLSIRQVSRERCKVLLAYSAPMIPDAICWWLMLGFGKVYLNYLDGPEAVGILAIAYKFPSLMSTFYFIFDLAWKETAVTTYKDKDRDSYYSDIFNKQVIFIISGIIILMPATRISVEFILAPIFQSAFQYIPLLFLGVAFEMLSAFWASGFESTKETQGILISTLWAFGTNAIANIILVPYISVYGVAIANIIGFATLYYVRKIRSKQFFVIRTDYNRLCPLTVLFCVFWGLYYLPDMRVHLCLLVASLCIFIYYNWTLTLSIANKCRSILKTSD